MSNDRDVLDAILRNDFSSFVMRCFQTLNPGEPFMESWHHDAIAFELGRVRDGAIIRLIINLPPRYGKSQIVSIAFVAFLLGHDPSWRIFVISYGAELADRHAADFLSIVESAWYKRLFPKMRIKRDRNNEVTTTRGGFRKATTVMGPLTGLGGDLFIIDDPQKTQDITSEPKRATVNNWVPNTLISRLNDKRTGAIILVTQRVHAQDLTGSLLEGSSEWEHLSLSAIAEADERIQIGEGIFHERKAGEALHPEREPIEVLEGIRRDMGSEIFSAQYQQEPVPPGGNMFKRAWFRYYDTPPARTYRSRFLLSWDTAAKGGAHNDWSVCTVWQVENRDTYYLRDMVRRQCEFPRLIEITKTLAQQYSPNAILIEDASTGSALQQMLCQQIRSVRLVKVEGDKVGRAYVQQHWFEDGRVLFPRGATFLTETEMELLRFPQGKNDDIVDSITQALAHKWGYDSTMSWVG
jgi:predicted phage terminase large subunit-like protein